MDKELHRLIAAYLAGDISKADADSLSDHLRDSPNTREQFIQAADIHASLSVDESMWTSSPGDHSTNLPRIKTSRLTQLTAIAATFFALLALLLLFRNPSGDTSFATVTHSSNAFWESGDLPTAVGSRLGIGTLRLAEGLATLTFDSGAEVVIEAPATLILVDSMNCQLSRGTAISDIPESALGFRIKTPSADVVDYGTKFAVSVYEDTGETRTQVMEGKVQVEYADSDKVIELETGQRNRVVSKNVQLSPGEGDSREPRTIPVAPINYGVDWQLIESSKDAYTGNVKGHESDVLLLVKNARDGRPISRTAYIGFDLEDLSSDSIIEAELLLHFSPTGWGFASHLPDSTFAVYALVSEVPSWNESILYKTFPGKPKQKLLGKFDIPQGVQKGRFGIQTIALRDWLREQAGGEVSLKIVRETQEIEHGGLVHGFASRRHPILPAPTLAIRSESR